MKSYNDNETNDKTKEIQQRFVSKEKNIDTNVEKLINSLKK